MIYPDYEEEAQPPPSSDTPPVRRTSITPYRKNSAAQASLLLAHRHHSDEAKSQPSPLPPRQKKYSLDMRGQRLNLASSVPKELCLGAWVKAGTSGGEKRAPPILSGAATSSASERVERSQSDARFPARLLRPTKTQSVDG